MFLAHSIPEIHPERTGFCGFQGTSFLNKPIHLLEAPNPCLHKENLSDYQSDKMTFSWLFGLILDKSIFMVRF